MNTIGRKCKADNQELKRLPELKIGKKLTNEVIIMHLMLSGIDTLFIIKKLIHIKKIKK